jgi:hypothetical protein
MRTPLRKIMRDQDRAATDQAIGEALRRVRLALGEVRVVERKQNGQVLDRRVVNKDAITRALRAYQAACLVVGKAREADGTTSGPMRPDRLVVKQACERLSEMARELDELKAYCG